MEDLCVPVNSHEGDYLHMKVDPALVDSPCYQSAVTISETSKQNPANPGDNIPHPSVKGKGKAKQVTKTRKFSPVCVAVTGLALVLVLAAGLGLGWVIWGRNTTARSHPMQQEGESWRNISYYLLWTLIRLNLHNKMLE